MRYAKQDDDQPEDVTEYAAADQAEMIRRLCIEMEELRGRWLVLCSSCSNPNPNPNPAQTGRVVRVLRTMAHSRGHRKTVRPAIDYENHSQARGHLGREGGL